MWRCIRMSLLGLALAFYASSTAFGAFEVNLHESGFSDLTIVDNDANDSFPATGRIGYFGAFGDYDFSSGTGLVVTSNAITHASPYPKDARVRASIDVTATGASPSPLTITVGDTGFSFPTRPPLLLSATSTATSASFFPSSGGSATVTGYADPNNTQFGQTVSTATLTSAGTTRTVEFNPNVPYSSNPYSLTTVITINMVTNQEAIFIAQSDVIPTPAPKSLVLAGAGLPLLGLGFLLRRRLLLA